MEWTSDKGADLLPIARSILDDLGSIRVVLLQGDLGSGKTTLIQALCRVLGVTEQVTSPTFALINVYAGEKGRGVYHMDMYRLESIDEALQIGVEDYLYSGEWCFVEWPALVEGILEPPFARITIDIIDGGQRKIRILKYTGNASR